MKITKQPLPADSAGIRNGLKINITKDGAYARQMASCKQLFQSDELRQIVLQASGAAIPRLIILVDELKTIWGVTVTVDIKSSTQIARDEVNGGESLQERCISVVVAVISRVH